MIPKVSPECVALEACHLAINSFAGLIGVALYTTAVNPLWGLGVGAVAYLINQATTAIFKAVLPKDFYRQNKNGLEFTALLITGAVTMAVTAAALTLASVPFTIATLAVLFGCFILGQIWVGLIQECCCDEKQTAKTSIILNQ